jgi:hypothetical protein
LSRATGYSSTTNNPVSNAGRGNNEATSFETNEAYRLGGGKYDLQTGQVNPCEILRVQVGPRSNLLPIPLVKEIVATIALTCIGSYGHGAWMCLLPSDSMLCLPTGGSLRIPSPK